MQIGVLLEVWWFMRCAATLMVLLLMASPIETATGAQRKDSSKETQENTQETEPKKASLRIEVLVVDPEKKSSQRVEDATVKIQGEEESYATGKDGKTRSFTVLPGARTVVIHVSSVKPCSVDLLVKEGHQDVTVLVEMLPKVKCTLQP